MVIRNLFLYDHLKLLTNLSNSHHPFIFKFCLITLFTQFFFISTEWSVSLVLVEIPHNFFVQTSLLNKFFNFCNFYKMLVMISYPKWDSLSYLKNYYLVIVIVSKTGFKLLSHTNTLTVLFVPKSTLKFSAF